MVMDEQTKQAVKKMFDENLKDDVQLIVITKKADNEVLEKYNEVVTELSNELKELDSRIKVEFQNFEESNYVKEWKLGGTPIILINPEEYKIVFRGAPVGHEFNSFLNTIIMVSQKNSYLSDASKEKLKKITKPFTLRTFVTPMCPHCPGMVILANKAAIENKNITAIYVEANSQYELSEKFKVSAVPQQTIDEDMETTSVGAKPEEMFIDYLIRTKGE